MKMKLSAVVLCLASAVAAPALAAPHVSLVDARKVALAKVPGTVVHEKTKHKKKGHDLYYFKIKPRDAAKHATTLKKIEIDSETGQVLKIKDVQAKAADSKDD